MAKQKSCFTQPILLYFFKPMMIYLNTNLLLDGQLYDVKAHKTRQPKKDG